MVQIKQNTVTGVEIPPPGSVGGWVVAQKRNDLVICTQDTAIKKLTSTEPRLEVIHD